MVDSSGENTILAVLTTAMWVSQTQVQEVIAEEHPEQIPAQELLKLSNTVRKIRWVVCFECFYRCIGIQLEFEKWANLPQTCSLYSLSSTVINAAWLQDIESLLETWFFILEWYPS